MRELAIVDVRGVLRTVDGQPARPAADRIFTVLRAPDRRPHPFCARSLLKEPGAEREDVDAVQRALLSDAVVGARAVESAEFPRGVLREDVSLPPR